MEKQITIIIPTYNMEKYIGRCLDSLLIPEIDMVEVLVVNDGSKDRSSEIAHNYAERYPDSIRVIDKPNGNYGSCINAALPQATGRYVRILDADDIFDTESFSSFVKKLPNISTDLVITEYREYQADGSIKHVKPYFDTVPEYGSSIDVNNSEIMSGEHFIKMHRISYKTDLIRRIDYRQTEGISYTDTEWAVIPLYHCKNFTCLDIIVYHYFLGREGQTVSPEKISKSINQLVTVFFRLIDFYNDYPTDSPLKKSLFIMTYYRLEFLCFTAMKYWDGSIAEMFKDFDYRLKSKNNDLYRSLNNIYYDEGMRFKFIKDIRTNNYPQSYSIPLWCRVSLSFKIRFGLFRKKFLSK